MTAALRRLEGPHEVRRRAEALARAGRLSEAAALIDGFLARHDAGWHLWRLCAELSRRLGRTGPAVAAYRACARQLEAAGHQRPAAAVLRRALALTPHDLTLKLDVKRLSTRVAPRPALPLETPPLPPRRPRLESVTDPHLAIFDILDDEARRTASAARPGRGPRHR
ncbi:MAG: hypothetical protein SFW67_14610 [Myxococcaceae bacterium]|nr:hypothetical protein [Myxococcaceae bacterium]